MPVRRGTIAAPVGLHARPAAAFVRAATETGLPVIIRRTGEQHGVDARSLLEVMSADFGYRCEVELVVDDEALSGPQARQEAADALDALIDLLESQSGS